jgi:replicative DNA helicase
LDGELSLQSIRVAARRKKKATGLHLLEVDYDELVDAPGKNELEQQRNLIRGSKSIGVSLGIPVVMISQLRKPPDAKEDKQPTLQRIYGSGAKSKHSSWILFIEREYVRDLEGDETEAMLYILKARDGRINKIALKFNLQTLRFDNAPPPVELPTGRAAGRKKAKKGGEE